MYLLFDLLSALVTPSAGIGFLTCGYLGWVIAGQYGAVIGALAGLFYGLWLDLSDSELARQLVWPSVAVAALAIVIALVRGAF